MFRPTLKVALLGLALAGLAGCASHEDDAPTLVSVQEYLKTAYAPAAHYEIGGLTSRWAWGNNNQHVVDLSLLVPVGQQHVPLIVYLPGLGETVESGELWRKTWADAGYAVLTLQSPRFDKSIYSSSDAQAGAFREIAQRSFSDASLAQRVEEVDRVLSEVKRRGAAGEDGFKAVDTQRIIVAGYDLGAQTAAALAGERDPGKPRMVQWHPLATILLSPYVPGGADRDRYRQIDTPTLTITGPQDEDPFSWIATAQQRYSVFANLGTPGSLQLKLRDAAHSDLSGTLPDVPKDKPKRDSSAGPGDGPGAKPAYGVGKPRTFDRRQAATIAAVSTAYLDATLNGRPEAKQWLSQQAGTWLGPLGNLEQK